MGQARRRAAIAFALTIALPALAARLGPETREAWQRYVAATEERIARELRSTAGFLVRDFLAPQERAGYERELAAGRVPVIVRHTVGPDGAPLRIDGGTAHHRLAAVLVPKLRLDDVLAFAQQYDRHHLHFREVEASRLLSRTGDVFEVFLRVRRERPEVASFNTLHHVNYERPAAGRAVSRSVTTRVRQLEWSAGVEKERPEGDDSGMIWALNSYWRFQERPDGVVAECEMVSLSRGVPFPVRWLFPGWVESLATDSLRETLLSLRAGALRVRAETPR
jgi:hypothetical protein